jgi:hypothetical protein
VKSDLSYLYEKVRCGSLWVVVGRCGSLWVVVGRCGSFSIAANAWVL